MSGSQSTAPLLRRPRIQLKGANIRNVYSPPPPRPLRVIPKGVVNYKPRKVVKKPDLLTKLGNAATVIVTDPLTCMFLAFALLSVLSKGQTGVASLLTSIADALEKTDSTKWLGVYIKSHEDRIIGCIIAVAISLSLRGDKRLILMITSIFVVLFGPTQKPYQYFFQALIIRLLFRFRNDRQEQMMVIGLSVVLFLTGNLYTFGNVVSAIGKNSTKT